jgi:hypothetical protein
MGPMTESRSQKFVYWVVVPLGVLGILSLGLLILAGLKPDSWEGWLKIGMGALCCAIAGGLAAAAWFTSYWSRTMVRQIDLWRRITDAFFTWLEEVPLPAEALNSLRSALDEAVPNSKKRSAPK